LRSRLELALTEIEQSEALPAGRLSPEQRVTVVYGTAILVLVLMNYATIDASVQVGASQSIVAAIGALSPALDDWLFPFRGLISPAVWALGCVVCYFVIPALVARTVLGLNLRDLGLQWEQLRGSLKLFAALYLPLALIVIAAAQTPAFQTMYPFYKDPVGFGDATVWALLYALQFFALEFFFRGFLCHGVRDLLGRHTILVMTVPYVMIHFPKPMFEAIGAAAAGIVLGFLSLRTRSIALGVALHVAVAWTMDVAALLSR
jgi:membrane protease YdiL (CAAX protease family)